MNNNLVTKLITRGIFLSGSAFATLSPCFAQGDIPPFMPNEVLVGIKRGQEAQAERAFAELGLRRIESIESLRLYRMRLPAGRTVSQAIEQLNRRPAVFQSPEPNFTVKAMNDPMFVANQQWGPGTIGAKWAWTLSVGNPNLKIAILDTGFARFNTHWDINAAREVSPYDAANNDLDPSAISNSHGTHVSGIALGDLNGWGMAGMDWGSAWMPVQVLSDAGWGTYLDVAEGIDWAVNHGANIINMSLGGTAPSYWLLAALSRAQNANTIVVAAAGNNINVPAYPAFYPQCIAVASSSYKDERSSFSNWNASAGTWIDVAAPGEWIMSSVLGNGHASWSGTSMAAPHVAGLAGLVWNQMGSGATAAQVRTRIENTCDPVKPSGTMGTTWAGKGRINAFRAVKGATTTTTAYAPSVHQNFGAGTVLTGNLASVAAADGIFRTSSSTLVSGQRQIHWLAKVTSIYECQAAVRKIDIKLKLKAYPVNLFVGKVFHDVYAFDTRMGGWTLIGTVPSTNANWITPTVSITQFASHYIDWINGDVLVKVQSRRSGLPFSEDIDQVEVRLREQ